MAEASQSWRDELLACGWQQGSLLPGDVGIEAIAWAHQDRQGIKQAKKTIERLTRESGSAVEKPVVFRRPLRDQERFVVLTQTCDLIKPPESFPVVDLGLVISTEKPAILAEADNFGSSRRYRLTGRTVDPPALVLDYGWRIQIDKGVLLSCAPDNSIVGSWASEDATRFARWLGRRYARPVLDDQDTKQIHEPIRAAWKAEEDQGNSAGLAAWNNEFAEIRFVRTSARDIYIYLVSPNKEPDRTLGAELLDWVGETLEDQGLSVTGTIKSYYELTVAERESSQELDLEWASDDEGHLSGPLPEDP